MTGDPSSVLLAAQLHRSAGNLTSEAGVTASSLQVETWTGLASLAFRHTRTRFVSMLTDQTNDLRSAADLITDYAVVLRERGAVLETARAEVQAGWAKLRTNPLDPRALFDVLAAQSTFRITQAKLRSDGDYTADALYALIASDTPRTWGLTWPPEGWPEPGSLQTVELDEDILENASFDQENVSQGGIGDCYAIASIMALMQTNEGDQQLRDNLRWDAARSGYWVTLYDDGEPVRYFVDKGQLGGATENGQPGIATIYEAALSQHLGFTDLDDGGYPEDALAVLTGSSTKTYDDRPWLGWDVGGMRSDVADGAQLVASTRKPDNGDTWSIEATQRSTGGANETVTLDVVGAHAYTIVKVEQDGSVWLLNPWGSENSADGGGPFRVSAKDFNTIFHTVASTGGNS